uniref:Uncharacterized protein n=2 Tax=viral metagenome TaxID=1070528 RepID=A0A6H1ZJR5_9ZZZZ
MAGLLDYGMLTALLGTTALSAMQGGLTGTAGSKETKTTTSDGGVPVTVSYGPHPKTGEIFKVTRQPKSATSIAKTAGEPAQPGATGSMARMLPMLMLWAMKNKGLLTGGAKDTLLRNAGSLSGYDQFATQIDAANVSPGGGFGSIGSLIENALKSIDSTARSYGAEIPLHELAPPTVGIGAGFGVPTETSLSGTALTGSGTQMAGVFGAGEGVQTAGEMAGAAGFGYEGVPVDAADAYAGLSGEAAASTGGSLLSYVGQALPWLKAGMGVYGELEANREYGVGQAMHDVGTAALSEIPVVGPALSGGVSILSALFPEMEQDWAAFNEGMFEEIGGWLGDVGEGIGDTVSGVAEAIGDAVGGLLDAFSWF